MTKPMIWWFNFMLVLCLNYIDRSLDLRHGFKLSRCSFSIWRICFFNGSRGVFFKDCCFCSIFLFSLQCNIFWEMFGHFPPTLFFGGSWFYTHMQLTSEEVHYLRNHLSDVIWCWLFADIACNFFVICFWCPFHSLLPLKSVYVYIYIWVYLYAHRIVSGLGQCGHESEWIIRSETILLLGFSKHSTCTLCQTIVQSLDVFRWK